MALSPLYRRGIVLGMIIAVGAFAVDMYIPSFAAIARDLHTGPGNVQLTMTAYFLSAAIGQIIYGPVSDAIGRKTPIFAGLALFAAGSHLGRLRPLDRRIDCRAFLSGPWHRRHRRGPDGFNQRRISRARMPHACSPSLSWRSAFRLSWPPPLAACSHNLLPGA